MNRNIDNLGRIVIPKEMRTALGISNGDPVHIELKDNQIILTKPGKTTEERIDKAIEKLKSKYIAQGGLTSYEVNDLLNELENILNGE